MSEKDNFKTHNWKKFATYDLICNDCNSLLLNVLSQGQWFYSPTSRIPIEESKYFPSCNEVMMNEVLK